MNRSRSINSNSKSKSKIRMNIEEHFHGSKIFKNEEKRAFL